MSELCDCQQVDLPTGALSVYSNGVDHTELACIPTPERTSL